LALFNIIYTSAPVFIYGLLEKNISDHKLLQDPALYAKISKNSLLTTKEFCIWLTEALWHSIGNNNVLLTLQLYIKIMILNKLLILF